MEFINQYVVVLVTLTCLAVGYIVKTVAGEKVKKFIPLIVGILGVAINIWLNHQFTPQVLCEGLISGLASSGLYDSFDNFVKKGGGKGA